MNPKGICALYIATELRTAITELHPYPNELYSVATIRANETLRIADLSLGVSRLDDSFARHLAICVQNLFHKDLTKKTISFPSSLHLTVSIWAMMGLRTDQNTPQRKMFKKTKE